MTQMTKEEKQKILDLSIRLALNTICDQVLKNLNIDYPTTLKRVIEIAELEIHLMRTDE